MIELSKTINHWVTVRMSTMTETLASALLNGTRDEPGRAMLCCAGLGWARWGQLLTNMEESIFGHCDSFLHNSASPPAIVTFSCLKLQILELHGLHLGPPGAHVGIHGHVWVLEGGLGLLSP